MENLQRDLIAVPADMAAAATRQMRSDVEWAAAGMNHGRTWAGSQRDIVELVHDAWQQDDFYDELGRPMGFVALLARVCESLNTPCPSNPTAVVNGIRCRKLARALTMTQRYAAIMRRHPDCRPITLFLNDGC